MLSQLLMKGEKLSIEYVVVDGYVLVLNTATMVTKTPSPQGRFQGSKSEDWLSVLRKNPILRKVAARYASRARA